MKALHSVRGDRSQLFERKGQMRNNSLHSTAQKTQQQKNKTKTGHPFLKKKRKKNKEISPFCLFDYFW